MLCEWWSARGLPALPKVMIRIASGIVAQEGEADIAVGWIYFDETRTLGVVDWITTNPSMVASPLLTEAIGHLLNFFEWTARDRGCKNLLSFVEKDTGLHRLLVRSGWQDPRSQPHVYCFKGLN